MSPRHLPWRSAHWRVPIIRPDELLRKLNLSKVLPRYAIHSIVSCKSAVKKTVRGINKLRNWMILLEQMTNKIVGFIFHGTL